MFIQLSKPVVFIQTQPGPYVLQEVVKFDFKYFKIQDALVLGLSVPISITDQASTQCKCLETQLIRVLNQKAQWKNLLSTMPPIKLIPSRE